MTTTQIIGAVLLALGALYGVGMFAYGKLKNRKPAPPVPTFTSSDAPAPIGITEYMDLIESASPTASAETRWQYAALGCTEADVLRREVARLGGEKKS